MSSLVFLVPGRLETRTGGYGYDRRIIGGLRDRGWTVTVHPLDESFPHPTSGALDGAAAVLAALPDDALVLVDGLAFGAMPDQVLREASRLRLVALVHHPLAAETGHAPDVAEQLRVNETRALTAARFVIVTSTATAEAMGEYGIARDRLAVVEPGTDAANLATGSVRGTHLLCVATLVPRKGHETLLRALTSLASLEWTLTCVGGLDRDAATVKRVKAMLRDNGLEARVSLAGEADGATLDRYYDAADLFVLATEHEGYGMAVAEALARGLPVVSTPTGAIAALVGPEAGVLVPPGDVAALTEALRRVLTDGEARGRLAAGARQVRARLDTWDAASANMAAVLDRLSGDGHVQR